MDEDFIAGICLFALVAVLAGCATALICTDHGDWAFLPIIGIMYFLFG